MIVDMPLAELERYAPPRNAEADFDTFWEQTLSEHAAQPLDATLEKIPYPVDRVSVYDLRYNGFGQGTRVAGWFIVPEEAYRQERDGRIPTNVQFHGYSGGRGRPVSYLHWALQGYCVLTVDTRGQMGETPDNNTYTTGGGSGWMTRGLLDPYNYYYRYVYMDCVRAISFLTSRPEIGPIILTGGSQGGALTLATAALAQDMGIVAAMPDVPYMSHIRRSIEVFSEGPYHELVNYWKSYPERAEASYRTLSYFDCFNLASRITCPTLFSIALLDTICPPSSCIAVYHQLAGEKELKVYPYNGHEGGGAGQEEEKYRFVRKYV